MQQIRNKLNQRIIINLNEGKKIDLLAKDTANVPDEDMSSPHMQTLLAKGMIITCGKIPQKYESKTSYMRKGKQ